MSESGFDPRVDAYIAKARPFAQPVMEHLRELVHRACPEVEETMKWSMPFFVYRGQILVNMAAFQQHCSFGLGGRRCCRGNAEGRRAGHGSRWQDGEDYGAERHASR